MHQGSTLKYSSFPTRASNEVKKVASLNVPMSLITHTDKLLTSMGNAVILCTHQEIHGKNELKDIYFGANIETHAQFFQTMVFHEIF